MQSSSATPFDIIVPATCLVPHVGMRLENGLSIIFVEDKESTKPAASMSIAVGQNNDPREFPGLAHFCEHMLFMGTEKFPSEDAYSKAVSRSGGHSNAFTASEATTYYFTSGLSGYKELLEMFLDFFIHPTFSASAVERELNAVHSEDEKNHAIDFWRIDELHRALITPDHPRHHYGNGNNTTLKHEPEAKGLSVHEAVRSFYNKYYVAERACLVLYSPFKAMDLLVHVEPILARMRRGASAPQSFLPAGTECPLQPTALRTWYNVLTTRKERKLRVSWVIPMGFKDWRRKPYAYVSHLIGHEVKGSILAALRAKGWGSDLSGGAGHSMDNDFNHFSITVTLTDAGLQHMTDVIQLFFQYLELIRRTGSVSEAAYSELKKEGLTSFHFQERSDADTYCHTLSHTAVSQGAEHAVLSHGYFVEDPSSDEQMRVLDYLTSDKCFVMLMAGEEEVFTEVAKQNVFVGQPALDKVTRFHGMKYSEAPIDAALIQQWSQASMASQTLDPLLALPSPNPYLSDDFTVYQPPAATREEPTRIDTKYGYALVKRNEAHLMTPRLSLILSLQFANSLTKSHAATVARHFYNHVLVRIVTEASVDMLYHAELASISFRASATDVGIHIRINGPSPTVPNFAIEALSTILQKTFLCQSEPLYERQVKAYVRSLQNCFEDQPYSLAGKQISNLLNSDFDVAWKDALAFAAEANYSGYCAFVGDMLKKVRVEAVMAGNMASGGPEVAKELFLDRLDKTLAASGAVAATTADLPPFRDFYTPNKFPASPSGQPTLLLSHLPPFAKSNVNAACYMNLYCGKASTDAWPLADVLGNLMSAHFFSVLRSTETLGYIVAGGASKRASRENAVYFIAQSSVAGPLYLYSRIHAFIDAYETQVLAKMSQSEVDEAVAGAIEARKALSPSVADEASSIAEGRLNPNGWDFKQKEIAFLESGAVTVASLQKFYREHVSNAASHRSGIVVLVDSEKLPEAMDVTQPVQLPRMKHATDSAGGADDEKDSSEERLVMSTFEQPTYVGFAPVSTRQEAVAKSSLTHVPL